MDRSTGIRTYNRLLFRVGIIFFTTLILSIFGAGVHSYYLVMKAEQEEALEMAEDIGELANIGEKEDTRQWILDYWESHYDEMDYLSPEVLLNNVKKATEEFVGEAPQFDDLTMLAINWHGKTS